MAIRAGVQQGMDAWRAALAGALADAVQAGAVDPGLEPQTTALFILSAWQGAIIAARAERSPAPFDAFFTMVFGKLLAASKNDRSS